MAGDGETTDTVSACCSKSRAANGEERAAWGGLKDKSRVNADGATDAGGDTTSPNDACISEEKTRMDSPKGDITRGALPLTLLLEEPLAEPLLIVSATSAALRSVGLWATASVGGVEGDEAAETALGLPLPLPPRTPLRTRAMLRRQYSHGATPSASPRHKTDSNRHTARHAHTRRDSQKVQTALAVAPQHAHTRTGRVAWRGGEEFGGGSGTDAPAASSPPTSRGEPNGETVGGVRACVG